MLLQVWDAQRVRFGIKIALFLTFPRETLMRTKFQSVNLLVLALATVATACSPATTPNAGGITTAVTPSITSLSPPGANAGSLSFVLTVFGKGFTSTSSVRWNGAPRFTTFVNGTTLSASIDAADVATTGTANIEVKNGSTLSNAASFTIASNGSTGGGNGTTQSLSSLSPSSAFAGGSGFTLTVAGYGFNGSSIIQWNGTARTTTYIDSGHLSTLISSSDVFAVGNFQVTVFTPSVGTSNALVFVVSFSNSTSPVPALTSLSPATATAGSPAFVLTVNGSNFVSDSMVSWNGALRTTTFMSTSQLLASIVAADVQNSGTVAVVVTSPAPGGGASNAIAFSVTVTGSTTGGATTSGATTGGGTTAGGTTGGATTGSGTTGSGTTGSGTTGGTTPGTPTTLAAGAHHSCTVASGRAYCWGANDHGQLGNGTVSNSLVPVAITGLGTNVQAITAGFDISCAIVGGAAYCWGANDHGQLGNATTVPSATPVLVAGLSSGVQAISAGLGQHVCAIANDAAYCWGKNDSGQLGDLSQGDSSTPMLVPSFNTGVSAIAVGAAHSCMIAGGAVGCWGNDFSSQIGDGVPVGGAGYRLAPVWVIASGGQAIAAGGSHSCAVVNGAAQCWGLNNYFQIGNPNDFFVPAYTPTAVLSLSAGVTAVADGTSFSCGLMNGGAQCWGDNTNGQLGTGAAGALPAQVYGLAANVTAIAAGDQHACAVIASVVRCWGANESGQLGTNTTVASTTPLDVGPFE